MNKWTVLNFALNVCGLHLKFIIIIIIIIVFFSLPPLVAKQGVSYAHVATKMRKYDRFI